MELTVAAFEEIRKHKKKIANVKLTNEGPINDIVEKRNFFQESYWTVKNRFLNGKIYPFSFKKKDILNLQISSIVKLNLLTKIEY